MTGIYTLSGHHQIYGTTYPHSSQTVYLRKQILKIGTQDVENAIQNAENLFNVIDSALNMDLIDDYSFDKHSFKLVKKIVKDTKTITEQINRQEHGTSTETVECKLKLQQIWLSLSQTEKYAGTNDQLYQGPEDILRRTKRTITHIEFRQKWDEINLTQDLEERIKKLNNLKKEIPRIRSKNKAISIAKVIYPEFNPRNSQIIYIKLKIISAISQYILEIKQKLNRDNINERNRSPTPTPTSPARRPSPSKPPTPSHIPSQTPSKSPTPTPSPSKIPSPPTRRPSPSRPPTPSPTSKSPFKLPSPTRIPTHSQTPTQYTIQHNFPTRLENSMYEPITEIDIHSFENEDDFEPHIHSTPERNSAQKTGESLENIQISLDRYELSPNDASDPIFMSSSNHQHGQSSLVLSENGFEEPHMEFETFVIFDRDHRTKRQDDDEQENDEEQEQPERITSNTLGLSKRISSLGLNVGITNMINSFRILSENLKYPTKNFLITQCDDLELDALTEHEKSLLVLSEKILASNLEKVHFCGNNYCFRLKEDVSGILMDKNNKYCYSTEFIGPYRYCKRWVNQIYPCTFSLETENCQFELIDNLDGDLEIEDDEHLLNDGSALINAKNNVIYQNGVKRAFDYQGYTLNKAINVPFGTHNITFFLDRDKIDQNFENLVGSLFYAIRNINQFFHEWKIFKTLGYTTIAIASTIGICYILYIVCWKKKPTRSIRLRQNCNECENESSL